MAEFEIRDGCIIVKLDLREESPWLYPPYSLGQHKERLSGGSEFADEIGDGVDVSSGVPEV